MAPSGSRLDATQPQVPPHPLGFVYRAALAGSTCGVQHRQSICRARGRYPRIARLPKGRNSCAKARRCRSESRRGAPYSARWWCQRTARRHQVARLYGRCGGARIDVLTKAAPVTALSRIPTRPGAHAGLLWPNLTGGFQPCATATEPAQIRVYRPLCGSGSDGIARHVPALWVVFARFDTRRI